MNGWAVVLMVTQFEDGRAVKTVRRRDRGELCENEAWVILTDRATVGQMLERHRGHVAPALAKGRRPRAFREICDVWAYLDEQRALLWEQCSNEGFVSGERYRRMVSPRWSRFHEAVAGRLDEMCAEHRAGRVIGR